MIYDTAYRTFRKGRILFSETISSVEYTDGDVPGIYIIPGLIDIHMHIESSMTHPKEFSRISLMHGTTTIVSDCHEIANVFSVKGLEDFMSIPVYNDTFYAIPSSVPSSSSELETSEGSFDENEIRQLSANPRIIALGEVMNAQDLLSDGDNRTKRIIKAFKEERPECPIEGHCPRLAGRELDKFIAAGVTSDHTEQTPLSIREKVSKGVFLQIQYKSVKKEIIEALSEPSIAPFFSFCTDDVMPDVLISEGHLDRIVRKAISLGMRPEDAIFAATYTPSRRMRLFDRGIIAPGCIADFVVLSDPGSFAIKEVWKRGERRESLPFEKLDPPAYAFSSIRRGHVRHEEFSLGRGSGEYTTIVHRTDSTMTAKGRRTLDLSRLDKGINIVAQVERYGHNAPIKPAILENGFTSPAAIASSWAHDNHNILVMATDEVLAAEAVNRVIDLGGGIVCTDGQDIIEIPLQYGGIVSLEPMEKLAGRISEARRFMRDHGWVAGEEIMCFAVLSLPVSPEVKITDKGLVDVRKKELIDWKS